MIDWCMDNNMNDGNYQFITMGTLSFAQKGRRRVEDWAPPLFSKFPKASLEAAAVVA
jgi:hypothetical protein